MKNCRDAELNSSSNTSNIIVKIDRREDTGRSVENCLSGETDRQGEIDQSGETGQSGVTLPNEMTDLSGENDQSGEKLPNGMTGVIVYSFSRKS